MSHIHIIHDFYSYPEHTTRTLRIYTPSCYDWDLQRHYPVLYMMDGQNVFSHPASALFHTWCANTTMDRLLHEGRTQPWIIVGIDHLPNRFDEYTPWPYSRKGIHAPKGHLFLDCVANHIKPFIDRTYRTLPGPEHTALMGASLGGLMALYCGYERPDVFGRLGAVSPTLMWSDYRVFDQWAAKHDTWSRIYMDTGDNERIWVEDIYLNYADITQKFYDHLRGLGYGPHEALIFVEPNANHHEIDWQRRFPTMVELLLNP